MSNLPSPQQVDGENQSLTQVPRAATKAVNRKRKRDSKPITSTVSKADQKLLDSKQFKSFSDPTFAEKHPSVFSFLQQPFQNEEMKAILAKAFAEQQAEDPENPFLDKISQQWLRPTGSTCSRCSQSTNERPSERAKCHFCMNYGMTALRPETLFFAKVMEKANQVIFKQKRLRLFRKHPSLKALLEDQRNPVHFENEITSAIFRFFPEALDLDMFRMRFLNSILNEEGERYNEQKERTGRKLLRQLFPLTHPNHSPGEFSDLVNQFANEDEQLRAFKFLLHIISTEDSDGNGEELSLLQVAAEDGLLNSITCLLLALYVLTFSGSIVLGIVFSEAAKDIPFAQLIWVHLRRKQGSSEDCEFPRNTFFSPHFRFDGENPEPPSPYIRATISLDEDASIIPFIVHKRDIYQVMIGSDNPIKCLATFLFYLSQALVRIPPLKDKCCSALTGILLILSKIQENNSSRVVDFIDYPFFKIHTLRVIEMLRSAALAYLCQQMRTASDDEEKDLLAVTIMILLREINFPKLPTDTYLNFSPVFNYLFELMYQADYNFTHDDSATGFKLMKFVSDGVNRYYHDDEEEGQQKTLFSYFFRFFSAKPVQMDEATWKLIKRMFHTCYLRLCGNLLDTMRENGTLLNQDNFDILGKCTEAFLYLRKEALFSTTELQALQGTTLPTNTFPDYTSDFQKRGRPLRQFMGSMKELLKDESSVSSAFFEYLVQNVSTNNIKDMYTLMVDLHR